MSDINEGWIKLHRKLRENPIWQEKRSFSKAEAWIDMLMEARHSEDPAKVLIGNHVVECHRGQIIKSLDTLAGRWGWNKSRVRRFLNLLENLEQIRHENVTKTTRITICNYDTYNSKRNEDETNVTQPRHASDTHLTPNKNVKKEKNVKNDKKKRVMFVKPSISDVQKYCNEIGFNQNAQAFVDYYEANGWLVGKNRMKDWKATIRNWQRRSGEAVEAPASRPRDPRIEFDRVLNQMLLDASRSSDKPAYWRTAWDKYKDTPKVEGHHVVDVAKMRAKKGEQK